MINYEKYYSDIKSALTDTEDKANMTSYVLNYGDSSIRRIPLDQGFELLFMNNLNFEKDFDVTELSTENAVEINYCFSGEVHIHFKQTGENLFTHSGQLCFNSLQGAVCDIHRKSTNHTGISIFIQQSTLERLLIGPYSEVNSTDFARLMNRTFYENVYTLTAGNIAIKSIAQSLLETAFPIDTPVKELTFRKHATALLYEAAEYILGMSTPLHNSPQIEIAKAILFDNLINPPSLERLAQMCNLSITSLKTGFKMQYCDTVFGVLRKERMRKGKQLLIDGASVAQAANEVGYANPSQFAKAFKKQFGVSPKEYKPHS